ncbi:LacI family DNA-binding transcriptional regulator [Urechidicola vernalis]|uniref:LacI family DNA-binding transcriptional regulator n=1 Tax=Urechidicola vernalis TaxID=3075600 RepID=A0ABU2Y488_9FLAO|nr:LacI family DNA-binding transcriptional regulator [Urechidicola sp. P050]MDT0552615.1 LacI family DNA-binding transcriptional regulator [Urechidicola sp. P050]
MRPKITLKKIAKEFEVSISTVSKALKDSNEISKDLREKIQAFAKLYNYKPNSLAVRLQNQQTKVIGVVVPDIVHHFFSMVIRGIEEVTNKRGYNVMICLSNESFDKEVMNIDMFTNGSVDGLIASISKETQRKNDYSHFKNLLEDDFPLVMFDRINEDFNCDKVIIDDVSGAMNATSHLIETGCEKIALVTTPNEITVGALRKKGYVKALQSHGLEADTNLMVEVNEKQSIREQIEELFDRNVPDGIFAVNEVYAVTAMNVAREKGFKIPEDISVIGFTDGPISQLALPPLTTVVQHGFTMGKQAAELLLDRIESKEDIQPQKIVLSTNLKIRKSTKSV